MRRYPEGTKDTKAHILRPIFVVDECHRAVSPLAQHLINQYFSRPLWYGFTGTPIFSEDAKDSPGDLPATTEEQYGKCLNKYTIKEALHDGAVLGFQVEYHNTFDMEALAAEHDILWTPDEDGYQLERALMQHKLLDAAYEDDQHMLLVVDFIINKASGKFGLNRGKGNTYAAILTTSSIKQAQRYYQLFKRVKEGKEPTVSIHDDIKRQLSDFPKVAITYSVGENNDKDSFNQDQMKESMQDYNAMFGTQYTMEQLGAYNSNINDRLARKKKIYQVRENQLDIVIVVDRLLTGFDAPCLSTLFIDRKPMRSYGIIQAFSRTNRLYDNQKRFGQIVIFQMPAHFKRAVDDAMRLYSSGGGNYVQAPSWEVAEARFKKAIRNLKQAAPTPEAIDTMSKAEKLRFLKAYREFDDAYSDVQVYSPSSGQRAAQRLPHRCDDHRTPTAASSTRERRVPQRPGRRSIPTSIWSSTTTCAAITWTKSMKTISCASWKRPGPMNRRSSSSLQGRTRKSSRKSTKKSCASARRIRPEPRYWMTYGMNIRISQKTL